MGLPQFGQIQGVAWQEAPRASQVRYQLEILENSSKKSCHRLLLSQGASGQESLEFAKAVSPSVGQALCNVWPCFGM